MDVVNHLVGLVLQVMTLQVANHTNFYLLPVLVDEVSSLVLLEEDKS